MQPEAIGRLVGYMIRSLIFFFLIIKSILGDKDDIRSVVGLYELFDIGTILAMIEDICRCLISYLFEVLVYNRCPLFLLDGSKRHSQATRVPHFNRSIILVHLIDIDEVISFVLVDLIEMQSVDVLNIALGSLPEQFKEGIDPF